MTEPTFHIEWKDDDVLDAEGDCHQLDIGTIADVMHITAAAIEGNTWDVAITQNPDEEDGEAVA